jgi:hypothetical protein
MVELVTPRALELAWDTGAAPQAVPLPDSGSESAVVATVNVRSPTARHRIEPAPQLANILTNSTITPDPILSRRSLTPTSSWRPGVLL